jgi:valyl-tRNA synthetase
LPDLDKLYDQYRLSEALMLLYKLFWDDFSSWYLEIIKPPYQKPLDKKSYNATIGFFDSLLRLLHPIMPFITEELWQRIEPREDGDSIVVAPVPEGGKIRKKMLSDFGDVMEIVSAVRSIRRDKNIPQKESLELLVKGSEAVYGTPVFSEVIIKLCNLSMMKGTDEKPVNAVSFMVKTSEYFIPLDDKLDVASEIAKIEKDLEYQKGFLASVMKKLGNERFVSGAPEKVIEMEKAKKADAESKIASLEARLKSLV